MTTLINYYILPLLEIRYSFSAVICAGVCGFALCFSFSFSAIAEYIRAEARVRDEHLMHVQRFIRRTHRSGIPVIFAGDANVHMFRWSGQQGYWMEMLSPGYRALRDIPGLPMVDTLLRSRFADVHDYYANPVFTSSRRNPYVSGSDFFASNRWPLDFLERPFRCFGRIHCKPLSLQTHRRAVRVD